MLLGAGGGHTECQPYLVQGAKLNEHDLARTFNVMATNIATIPRFLLPQLTWRASTFRPTSSVSRSLIRVSNGDCRQSQYRPISSQTTAWKTSQLRKIHTTTHISITSSTCLPYRSFYTSRPLYRDHHFDTLKFVQRLKDEGVSEDQAVAMMRVLSDVIEESIQNLTRTMVLREDAERSTYTQKVDFTKLRSELLSSDSTETQLTRASHERLTNDLAKLNSRLRDEISRTQASVRLDLNLEKGRIREEANVQELKIKETETRIEQEVAGLRERVEGVKFSTLQWLM
ncbi:hypothetical protein MMC06_006830 [Schaereria dolodes]|nr:hypothetical protein [Schaereria dolodes]